MTNYIFLIAVLVVLIASVITITFVDFKLSDDQYDKLKKIVMKWPGVVTLLGVIVSTFTFAYGEETLTLVSAIGTFLAYCLDISAKVYDAKGENDEYKDL